MKAVVNKHASIMSVRRYLSKPVHATVLLILALLMQTIISGQVQAASVERRDAMEYFFNQSFNNLNEELEIVKEEGKSGVFIMFSDEDCPWCLKMKMTIMNRVDVQKYYREHFRVLTVDINGGTLMTDFAGNEMEEKEFSMNQHRVRATPVFIFFDTSGKKTMRLTGIVRDAREFLWLGEYVVNGDYQKINFTKYKRERAKQDKQASLK